MNDKEKIEKYKSRIKRQNEAAKNNWDRVSCMLPKGTKERITSTGESLNGFMNRIILAELDRIEANKNNKQ